MHWLLILGMGVVVVASCLLAGAAWRLSRGPIDLGAWSDRAGAAFIGDSSSAHVSFSSVSLVWEGFSKGADYPLDIRLTDVVLTGPADRPLASAPDIRLTVSLAGLIRGRIVPRTIGVDHASIAVTRDASGTIGFGLDPATTDPSPLGSLREQLSHTAANDHDRSSGLFGQLVRVHIRDSAITLRDQPSGLVVRAAGVDFDMTRTGAGRVDGVLRASLSVGDEQTVLTATAAWTEKTGTRMDAAIAPFQPSGLGQLPPALAFLTGIDLPVSLNTTIRFDPGFDVDRFQADILVGSGHVRIAQGRVPVRSGVIRLTGTPARLTLTQARFDVAHTPDGAPEIVDIVGTAVHAANRLTAFMTIGLDRIDIADLPLLWPQGVAGGARPWVMEHVTAGMATHGSASFAFDADDTLQRVTVTQATGDLDGTGGRFTWFDDVPPIEQAEFHLHLANPDTLDIRVASGRQRLRDAGVGLSVKNGLIHIAGLSARDQTAAIQTEIEGPLISVLDLLTEPALHLLSVHPIGIAIAGGDAAANLTVQLPLEHDVRIDDVRLHADAHLTRVRLPGIAAGQTVDDGTLDLGIDTDGMTLKGRGSVAAIPVTADGRMDFLAGPPDQILQTIAVSAQPAAAQLAAAGLPIGDVLDGPIPFTVVLTERRNGAGSVAIDGDLTNTRLSVHPLAWVKPPGSVASASALVSMTHDRMTKIDRIAIRGDGLLLTGSADAAGGTPRAIVLDTIALGRTRAVGTIRFVPDQPLSVVLQGDQIDLSAKLTETTPASAAAPAATPDWSLDARFGRVILANGENGRDVAVNAAGAGEFIRLLTVTGTIGASSAFSVKIEPVGGKRRLLASAEDAGRFLRGMDAVRGMQAGRLSASGVFDTPLGLQSLTGTVTIDDTVVKRSPALLKLLQAITLYGLVDVLRGPGIGFSHIVVPFRYDGTSLGLDGAHASNASLGLTASGRIGLPSGQAAMTGTIVPAYFFNSMLGKLPLVGKLFSPENGGGVFAARFSLSGRIDDPSISVNPLSVLTPGFLRDIFTIFDRTPPNTTPDNGK